MAEIVKVDCQNEDPIMILVNKFRCTSSKELNAAADAMLSLKSRADKLEAALRRANSYIDSTPLMPGNSYKEIKAVISAALECGENDG